MQRGLLPSSLGVKIECQVDMVKNSGCFCLSLRARSTDIQQFLLPMLYKRVSNSEHQYAGTLGYLCVALT